MADFIKQIYKKEDAFLKKTVFLDRDGILIKNVDYLSDPSQIDLLPGVVEGIKKLNKSNTVLIVVTNQPVIARGLASIIDVEEINNFLTEMLKKEYAYINAIYFCPHHPEKHHADIPPKAMKYRIECECRKPKTGMLKKAAEDFNINLGKTFIVGDDARDIKAGENLGIKTILVQKEQRNKGEVKADYIVSDFGQAVDVLCKE